MVLASRRRRPRWQTYLRFILLTTVDLCTVNRLCGCGWALHGTRHTYASLALRAGVDIKRVQASLGHATAAFTLDVYGHVTAAGLRDAAATFDRAVFGDTILDRF